MFINNIYASNAVNIVRPVISGFPKFAQSGRFSRIRSHISCLSSLPETCTAALYGSQCNSTSGIGSILCKVESLYIDVQLSPALSCWTTPEPQLKCTISVSASLSLDYVTYEWSSSITLEQLNPIYIASTVLGVVGYIF